MEKLVFRSNSRFNFPFFFFFLFLGSFFMVLTTVHYEKQNLQFNGWLGWLGVKYQMQWSWKKSRCIMTHHSIEWGWHFTITTVGKHMADCMDICFHIFRFYLLSLLIKIKKKILIYQLKLYLCHTCWRGQMIKLCYKYKSNKYFMIHKSLVTSLIQGIYTDSVFS